MSFISFIWLVALVSWCTTLQSDALENLADSGRFGSKCCTKRFRDSIALKSMKSRARLPDTFENGKSDGQIQSWSSSSCLAEASGLHACISRLKLGHDKSVAASSMIELHQTVSELSLPSTWRMIRGRLYIPSFHPRHSKKRFGIRLGTARSQTM